MHILFLTDNFPPEGNAPASRTFEHAIEWVQAGAKVTVITCVPNFPEGEVFDGYKNRWYQKEKMDGIEVRRVKTYITANEGFVKCTLDYMSFMVMGFFAGLFVRKPSVVVATSPQFFCACAGWMLSVFKWRPFVFELRDIWPASIKAVGVSSDGILIKTLEALELFLYRRAELIVSVTDAFRIELISRGIASEKIKVIRNGVNADVFKPVLKDPKLEAELDLSDKFVAGYIGTHGLAHALETIVEAAEQLREDTDIVFILAGGGAALSGIQQLVKEKGLQNVKIMGRQDKSLMPQVWSLCDVSIIHLRNQELFSKVIPSKLFECVAMGCPIIMGLPKGEATGIVESHKLGVVIEPENPGELASAVKALRDKSEIRLQYSRNAISCVDQFSRTARAKEMLRELNSIVAEPLDGFK
jgi:glycosyltransferase involved in cell wall biosynthesis